MIFLLPLSNRPAFIAWPSFLIAGPATSGHFVPFIADSFYAFSHTLNNLFKSLGENGFQCPVYIFCGAKEILFSMRHKSDSYLLSKLLFFLNWGNHSLRHRHKTISHFSTKEKLNKVYVRVFRSFSLKTYTQYLLQYCSRTKYIFLQIVSQWEGIYVRPFLPRTWLYRIAKRFCSNTLH